MKRIIFLLIMTLSVISASAQYYSEANPKPCYDREQLFHGNDQMRYYKPMKGKGYRRIVTKADYDSKQILVGAYAPEVGLDWDNTHYRPNYYNRGRRQMPFWPQWLGQDPEYYYYARSGNNVFFNAAYQVIGVAVDNQITFAAVRTERGQEIFVWETKNGALVSRIDVYNGMHRHFEVQTDNGLMLAEVFVLNGVRQLNWLTTSGQVVETYTLH